MPEPRPAGVLDTHVVPVAPLIGATVLEPRPLLVLDTNIVLDWLWFANPACASLGQRIVRGQVRWIATGWMRDELGHVLRGSGLVARHIDPASVWAAWDRHAEMLESVELTGAALRLRCTDANDQPFIDLALGRQARWLVSRDRAVLKLARRARPHGLVITLPGVALDAELGALAPPS